MELAMRAAMTPGDLEFGTGRTEGQRRRDKGRDKRDRQREYEDIYERTLGRDRR
jgi:hypothetical protein